MTANTLAVAKAVKYVKEYSLTLKNIFKAKALTNIYNRVAGTDITRIQNIKFYLRFLIFKDMPIHIKSTIINQDRNKK